MIDERKAGRTTEGGVPSFDTRQRRNDAETARLRSGYQAKKREQSERQDKKKDDVQKQTQSEPTPRPLPGLGRIAGKAIGL